MLLMSTRMLRCDNLSNNRNANYLAEPGVLYSTGNIPADIISLESEQSWKRAIRRLRYAILN
jgi:hypothetical protein